MESNIVFDYKGIRNTVNEMIIKGDALINSYILASGLHIQAIIKKEDGIKIIGLDNERRNTKIKVDFFINDSQTDLAELITDTSSLINKLNELQADVVAKIETSSAILAEINSRTLTPKDLPKLTNWRDEAIVLKEKNENYTKLGEQGNNCIQELNRALKYSEEFLNRFQEILTKTDDLVTFHS